MPWIGCELWVGECAADGSVGNKRLVAGGDDELIFQPEWSPDGTLYFVSDRAQPSLEGRWWNLFRVRGDALDKSAAVEPVYPLAAEFGRAQWHVPACPPSRSPRRASWSAAMCRTGFTG